MQPKKLNLKKPKNILGFANNIPISTMIVKMGILFE